MRNYIAAGACYAAFIRLTELVIGSVLVLSAWLHLQNYMLFYIHVAQYKLLPTFLLPFVVLTLPWLLLLTGMLIITRAGRPVGAVVGAGLFLLFTIAQLAAMGYGISCGCFGSALTEEVGLATTLRTGLLFGGCVILAVSYKRELQ
jgi:hypothetical protein